MTAAAVEPVAGSAEWVARHGLSAVETCRLAQRELARRDPRIFSLEADLGDSRRRRPGDPGRGRRARLVAGVPAHQGGAAGAARPLDRLLAVVRGMLAQHPDIAAFVSECTMLPTCLDAVREAGLPVYDILTTLDLAMSGAWRPAAAGPAAAPAPATGMAVA